MAEERLDFEQKTEPPSPRRREQAQEEGQVAHSGDLSAGLVLFIGAGGLLYLAQELGGGLLSQTRLDLATLTWRDLTLERVQQLFTSKFTQILSIAGSLIGLLYVSTLTVNIAQVGFHFNMAHLAIDWERIAPYRFDRLISWSKTVRGLLLVLKITAIAAIAWWILARRGQEIAHVNETSLAATLVSGWRLVVGVTLSLAGAMLLIGLVDYGYQRWQFERSLYMSKQEVKEELKREEGNPQVRLRIRKLQRENARRKMFHKVRTATVVVTNPTHLAVALRYEAGKMAAPKVVAKGADHVAKRIVEIARQNNVPVVERKPLAQALFRTVKLDQDIPIGLYFVVAEVMAYVYQLKGQKPSP